MSGFQCSRCDLSIGDCINQEYIVEKPLGEGAFGQVFKVKKMGSTEYYALKLLKLWTVDPSDREKLLKRFKQEYDTGHIHSDYLVQSYDKGSLNGNPYILMEFCPGGDLLQAVESSKVELTKMSQEVLLGLKALHANGKVHRDLKPENVLIKYNGTAALTDFGISGDRNKRLTERGISGVPKEIFGTYAYMPPEQINPKRGDATVLPTTDIFSFGVMMYQLLTCEMPFGPLCNESDLYLYVRKVATGEWNRDLLQRTPEGNQWKPLIEGCLHPDFRQRLQTADEVITLLPYRSSPVAVEPEVSSNIYKIHTGIALRIMQGEEYGKVYKLNDIQQCTGRKVLTMGRNDDGISNIIAIKEDDTHYISRKHCTIEYNDINGTWLVRDGQWDKNSSCGWRQSTNGTFLDSQEVSTNGIYIQPGNILSIGDVKIRVEGY